MRPVAAPVEVREHGGGRPVLPGPLRPQVGPVGVEPAHRRSLGQDQLQGRRVGARQLAADLVDNGITMAGGSSMLRGLTTVISNATGLDVRLAEDPLTCVARGTSVYLENLELWKDTMESDQDDM